MAVASPPPITAPAGSPSLPRPGQLLDHGTVRRDSVDADRWTAHGAVKVTGDVHVGEGDLEGVISVGGKLTATTFRSRGTLEVDGAIDIAGALTTTGSLRAALSLHAGEADLRGDVHALGPASFDRTLSMRGSLAVPALTSGMLRLEGGAQIPGDLIAQSVSARLTGDSSFWLVRARSVTLHGKIPNLVEKVLGRKIDVKVRRIEADEVDLEGVDVKFVHSPRITLGREAHITEYEGTIVKRHPSSRVGFESRSPPPYGLRR